MPAKLHIPSPLIALDWKPANQKNLNVWMKRDDLIHPWIQGNKWRKLKYILEEVRQKGMKKIVSPGGAFSNHLLALAAYCHYESFRLTALIRGEDDPQNPILQKIREFGTDLLFVPRTKFRSFHGYTASSHPDFPDQYYIPEGGTNLLALRGVGEIIDELRLQMDQFPDFIITPMGTGGTFAGLWQALPKSSKLVGVSMVPNYPFEPFLRQLLGDQFLDNTRNMEIIKDQDLGRFGKLPDQLLEFILDFYRTQNIALDPIYTGKMMWKLKALIIDGYFPEQSNILVLHTGGLMGWEGFKYIHPEKVYLSL